MSNITKQSVKLETGDLTGEDVPDAIADTLFDAVDRLFLDGDPEEELTNHFFTIRFDKTESNGIAATVTASEKRN